MVLGTYQERISNKINQYQIIENCTKQLDLL